MALTLAQLVQPMSANAWNQVLLNGLQGVGQVTQAGMVVSPEVVSLIPTLAIYENVQVQVGTGIVQAVGPAGAAAQVVVIITSSGNVGSGYFNYSLDGGMTFNPNGPFLISANVSATLGTYLIPQLGVTLIFSNGLYASPYAPLDANGAPSTFIGLVTASSNPQLGETYSFTCTTPAFPVTNWPIGGTARTIVQADAQALTSLDLLLSQVIAAGYPQSWITPPAGGPPPSGWLDLLSQWIYNRLRFGGAQTQGLVLVSAVPTAGPYTLQPGQLTLMSSTGQLFYNVNVVTIPRGGSVSPLFGASALGGSFNSVVADNPIYGSTPTHSGTGLGLVGFGGTPYSYNPVVKITTSSNTTGPVTAQFDYSLDGGATYSGSPQNVVAGPMIYLGTTQIFLTFTGSPTTTGQWIAGDAYASATAPLPGSNILTQMVNPLPGVTVGNFLLTGPTVTAQLEPGSSGAVAVAGIPNAQVQAIFTVVTPGAVGVGTWSYSTSLPTSGGLIRGPTVGPIVAIMLGGQTVTPTPTGTFQIGDTFSYSNNWITQQGADPQSDPSLASADQNQWAELAPDSPTGVYQNWALAASPEVVSAAVSIDPTVAGQVDVALTGANNGPVSQMAVQLVQNYIEARAPLTVTVVVTSVVPVSLQLLNSGAAFFCSPGALGAVQQAVAQRLYGLQVATPPGGTIAADQLTGLLVVGSDPNGISGLVAIDLNALTFNGFNLQTTLGPTLIVQLGQSMSLTILPPAVSAYSTIV